MLLQICDQPGCAPPLRHFVRSAHWIWSNGIGRRASPVRAWTSLPSSRARLASDRTHCDSIDACDHRTRTAAADSSSLAITSE
jgi:hypothetical protein